MGFIHLNVPALDETFMESSSVVYGPESLISWAFRRWESAHRLGKLDRTRQ